MFRGLSSDMEAASSGAVAVSCGASSGAGAATGATSSGRTVETANGLHSVPGLTVASNPMATKGNKAVTATVLADQAEEKGGEWRHLTGAKRFSTSLLLFLVETKC